MAAACARSERGRGRAGARCGAHAAWCALALLMVVADARGAPRWTLVELEAHKLFLSASTRLSLVQDPDAALGAELLPVPGHSAPGVPAAGMLRLEAMSRAPGVRSRLRLWLARDTLALLQRERLDSGRDRRYRVTRSVAGGWYEWRHRADARTRELAPAQWPLTRERFAPQPERARATDALALLLLAGELVRGGQQRADVLVATGADLVRVTLLRAGTETLETRPERILNGQPQALAGRIRGERVRFTAPPGTADAPALSLLGLEGDITVWVDAESGAPLRLRGRDPLLGELTVEARRIEYGS